MSIKTVEASGFVFSFGWWLIASGLQPRKELVYWSSECQINDSIRDGNKTGQKSSNEEDFGRGRGRGRGSERDRGDGSRISRDKSHVRCYKFNEPGHNALECPKWEQKEEVNLTQNVGHGTTLM